MTRSVWFRFACRAAAPGLAWMLIAIAGCSSGGSPAAPQGEGQRASEPAKAPAVAPNPMPLDVYASAMVPRWIVPEPERPAFTPHWYTPSVDPLFRRRGAAPTVREGAPSPDDPPSYAPSDAPAAAARRARVATPADPPQGLRRAAGQDENLKDFHMMEPLLTGVASWYGPGFHGKPTASGEIYDQHRMTAAHPSLPLGTIIRVENESNGTVVWVRVNDRGPYAKGRVLDLSRAAAERLGMVDEGTTPVRISVLRWPSDTDTELGLRAYSQYVVQVAAYPEPDKAEAVLQRMQAKFGWAPFLLDGRPNGVLSVVAGPYDDGDDANRVARRLQKAGVTSLVRRYRK